MGKGILLTIGGIVLGVVVVGVIRELGAVNEALTVVIGVIFGVGAAIPTSLLLLVVLTRSERRRLEEEGRIRRQPRKSYPAAVVIQGDSADRLPKRQYPPIIVGNGRGQRVMLEDGTAGAVRSRSNLLPSVASQGLDK